VVIEDASGKVLGGAPASAGPPETRITLADGAAAAARARLTGTDAIASDDVAPVVTGAGRGSVAVVADPSDESVVTGGPPIVEQALSALELDIDVRALPALPDRAEELSTALGIVLDDPPGMTPEQRHTLEAFLEKGGVVLATLGPHAAAAPLGATLQPILAHGVVWSSGPGGAHLEVDTKSAVSGLVGAAGNLDGLDAARRATLAPDDAARFEALVKWTDGAPLVARRTIGRGEAWVISLPMSVDASDLPLRASFLGLLSGWIRTARDHASPVRTDVATPWKFPGAARLEATGPDGLLTASRDGADLRLVPEVAGDYEVRVDGRVEHRVAAPIARELDLRPRGATAATGTEKGLRDTAAVDASGPVALALLALMALELGLRLRARTGALPQAGSAG
jgi:hypothetical protein